MCGYSISYFRLIFSFSCCQLRRVIECECLWSIGNYKQNQCEEYVHSKLSMFKCTFPDILAVRVCVYVHICSDFYIMMMMAYCISPIPKIEKPRISHKILNLGFILLDTSFHNAYRSLHMPFRKLHHTSTYICTSIILTTIIYKKPFLILHAIKKHAITYTFMLK